MKTNNISSAVPSVLPPIQTVPSRKAVSTENSLNREFCKAPQDLFREHEHGEAMWNLAKATAVFGYMTLGLGTFVATSIFAPEMILFVTFAVFLTMPTAVNAYSFAEDRATEHALEKEKYARIAEIHQNLASLSPIELRQKFATWGLTDYSIAKFPKLENGLRSLLPGFAAMLYQAERTHQLYAKKQKLLDEANDAKMSQFRLMHLREAYFTERAALASEINTAFLFGLLKHPFSQISLDEIGHAPMFSPEEFSLERYFGNTPPVFIFKNEGKAPLRQEQLVLMRGSHALHDLSQDLFHAEGASKNRQKLISTTVSK